MNLLVALRQKVTINLTLFLNYLLHEIVDRIGKAKDPNSVISHHCLIKLIVSRELNQAQITWDHFVGNTESKFQTKTPTIEPEQS